MTGNLSSGAVAMIDRSLSSDKAKFNDLGIGVAERLSISTSSFKVLIFSFCLTPKRCSSSIINKPRSLNLIFPCNKACVPMTISISPEPRSCSNFSFSLRVIFLDNAAMLIPLS